MRTEHGQRGDPKCQIRTSAPSAFSASPRGTSARRLPPQRQIPNPKSQSTRPSAPSRSSRPSVQAVRPPHASKRKILQGFSRRAFVHTTCRCTEYNRLQRLRFPSELRAGNGHGQERQDGHERGSDRVHPVHPVESRPGGTKRNNVERFGRERSRESFVFRAFREICGFPVPPSRGRRRRRRPTGERGASSA
jgi:hypothetical protein